MKRVSKMLAGFLAAGPLNQTSLAERCGIDQSRISAFLNDREHIGPKALNAIIAGLRLPKESAAELARSYLEDFLEERIDVDPTLIEISVVGSKEDEQVRQTVSAIRAHARNPKAREAIAQMLSYLDAVSQT